MNQDAMTKEQREFEDALIEFEKAQAPEPKTLNDLSWIARQIKALEYRIAMTQTYRATEIEKIAACAGDIIEKKQEQINSLTIMAMNFLKSEGYCYADKKLRTFSLPGLGKFAFSTTRESVNIDDYNDLSDDEKTQLQKEFPQRFNAFVKISPNKTNILAELTNIVDNVVPQLKGFHINHKQETFKFKGE